MAVTNISWTWTRITMEAESRRAMLRHYVTENNYLYRKGFSNNFYIGCSHVDDGADGGCTNYYADAYTNRMGQTQKPWTAENAKENVQRHPLALDILYRLQSWAAAEDKFVRVFINSMWDIGHHLVPDSDIELLFDTIAACPNIEAIGLTKRLGRFANWKRPLPTNLILGTSIAARRTLGRMRTLERVHQYSPHTRLLISFEPLVGRIGALDPALLAEYSWIIVGGESGPSYRPMDLDWARELRQQTLKAGVALFEKQRADRLNERRMVIDGCYYWQWPGEMYPPVWMGNDGGVGAAGL